MEKKLTYMVGNEKSLMLTYANIRTKFSWKEAFLGWGGVMLILAGILLCIGLMGIYSASYNYKTQTYNTFIYKQMVFAVISIVPFVFVLLVDYTWLVKKAYWIYAGGLLLLFATALFGTVRNDSKRWLNLGIVMLQTAEVMKLAILPILARILTQERTNSFWDLMAPLLLIVAPMLLIMKQPDLGTSLVFVPIVFVMSFVAGVKVKYHFMVIVCMLMLAFFSFFYLLHDYQRNRVLMFLRQGSMSQEEKQGTGYHLYQAKIAFGNGGFWGMGWQKGTQNRFKYLPENHTDFIFGVIGEEFGFVGTTGLLLIYLCLFVVMLKISLNVLTPIGQLMAVGATTILITHTIINISMTIGLMPVVGIPLPFVSYGGSALMFNFIEIALVFSISGRTIDSNDS